MMKRCLDEGLMQSYLDGELSPDATRDAASHIARCSACVEAMASARNESGFIAQAFAPGEHVDVPTERLRSRVNAAISQFESATVQARRETQFNVNTLLASLSALIAQMPRRAGVAFASLAVAACALIFVLVHHPAPSPNEVAVNENQAAAAVNLQPTHVPSEIVKVMEPPPIAKVQTGDVRDYKFTNVSDNKSRSVRRARMENTVYVTSRDTEAEKLLASEMQYHETIASLNKIIAAGGEAVLRPAVRADYERNVAVLDNAIAETRNVALRNPKDRDAVNFLMSAYQSKVELLTTVANQAQVATLGR